MNFKNHFFLLFLIFLIVTAKAQTYIINTIAGNGTSGYSGDGAAATLAKLNYPSEVAVDGAGNVYIADTENNVIRKITTSTGIISTIAGTGRTGYSGDGEAATSAELNGPTGVSVDALGNVYIADNGNDRIRMVSAGTGIISTIAGNGKVGYSGDGGAATLARLDGPDGLVADDYGNIYFADQDNNVIRKVTASTGIISTITGTGRAGYSGDGGAATSATLYTPSTVAIDASGNIYIADEENNVIRKVIANTGIISTIAGTGITGYSGDGAAATLATLYTPTGVAVDGFGNVYIADYGNNKIRKVNASTGIISTIAGTGMAGYSGDGGAATSAKLNSPNKVAVDNCGNVYFSDRENNVIRKLTYTTSCVEPVKFISFTAQRLGSSIALNWSTASEQNSFYFDVEKSADAVHFTSIGSIKAARNSSSILNYSYTDNSAEPMATIYYRIVEYDLNGGTTISIIESVNIGELQGVKIYPNPNSGNFIVQMQGQSGIVNLVLSNSLGQIFYEYSGTALDNLSFQKNIDIQTLPSGVYILNTSSSGNSWINKIIKE